MTHTLRCLTLLACCFSASIAHAAPEALATTDDFTEGTHALDQQRWQDAVTDFDSVVRAHEKRADAALYWKAYALNKLNRPNLVSATCNQLRATYPRSTWNGDCTTLFASAADRGIYAGQAAQNGSGVRSQTDVRDDGILLRPKSSAQLESERKLVLKMQTESALALSLHVDPSVSTGSDADLKMLALNSVLQRDPNRAIPVIRDILTGNNPPELKRRAINVLAMSSSPEAQATLRDVATGKLAPTEQKPAIQMLGVYQGKRAGDTLAEIYRNSSDSGIKHAALSGLFVSSNAQQLVDLARNEKDLKLKHDIVAQLALMHDKVATDYMLELLK